MGTRSVVTTIGFIGLGAMGAPIASRLIDAGNSLRIFNRTPTAIQELARSGVIAVGSPDDALSAEISFSMLADDEAAEAVLGGATLAPGLVHVNMASISPAAADRLAERFSAAGAFYIAAPVLGRPEAAADGQLHLLVAGPTAQVEAVLPVLEQISKRIWRIGEQPSSANAVKVAVNYNLIHVLQALGESVTMIERRGIEPTLFVDVLTSSLFAGVAYSVYGAEIAAHRYTPPAFSMALGYKDLGLARDLADAGGVNAATMHALFAVFERALSDPELAASDWGAIAEVTRRDLL